MVNKTIQLEETYEIFLSKIDDNIEYLEKQANELNLSLDINDKESLSVLEKLLETNKISVDDFEYEAACAFLGDFIRIHFNGKWELCLDEKDNSLYYGTPVITGLSPVHGVLYSPFMALGRFLHGYPSGWLMNSIQNEINPPILNLDDLQTDRRS